MAAINQVSQYLAAARTRELPAEVARKAKHHILDTIAAMVSGAKLKPGRLALRYGRSQRGKRESSVAASSLVLPVVTAAMVNGILAHADETDDTHYPSRTHPGCAIVPAALAMAERENSDGGALLKAVVAGYDVGCRLTRSLGHSGWHSTHSIGGTFGAAAAASVLADLNIQEIRWALSYAAQQASGIRSWVADSEHIEKAFDFGGMPARNGVTAALLVQAGFTGMADVFEGEKGFLAAYSSQPNPQRLVEGLGSRYEIMETSIKGFPVGAPIQAAVQAFLRIKKIHDIPPESVAKLVVRLSRENAETVNNRLMPDINAQYIMAVLVLDGALSFEAAHDYRRARDKKVLALKAKIELLPDEELSRASTTRPAVVEIMTQSGETFREHVASPRGTPENPMTDEEVERKALGLIAPVLGEARSQEIVEKIRNLEFVESVRDLGSLLRKK